MPIVNFDGSDALLDLAVLGTNHNDCTNEIKPTRSILNISRSSNRNDDTRHNHHQQQEPEPEDDIISEMTNPSVYPGGSGARHHNSSNNNNNKHDKNTLPDFSQNSSQFQSSFAMAFSNVVMRRGSECAGTTSTPTSSQQQQVRQKQQPRTTNKQNQQHQESHEDLLDKMTELQKENEELKSFSQHAIKCVNDLTEKQISIQHNLEKEINDNKETCEMYKLQQDEHLMTIKLLTHEKKELQEELRKLRRGSFSWNKMTDRINSSRNLAQLEQNVNDLRDQEMTKNDQINDRGHRRSLSDESSLNSNINLLTTHSAMNATGKFPAKNSTMTPSTTATSAIASSDNESFIHSVSEEQHQAYNDICDKYLFDRSSNGKTSINSSFRSSASSANMNNSNTPSVITTSNRSTCRPVASSNAYGIENKEINTIQEDLFYDSDDTSSWGAKQLQRRVAAMQRAQRTQNNNLNSNKMNSSKHSTAYYEDDDVRGSTFTNKNIDIDDDESDVRTLQFDEQKSKHSITETKVPSPPTHKSKNILDHVPIIAVRNRNNDTNNRPRMPGFNRPAVNVNPTNWLSSRRPSAISHTLDRKNRLNLRIGRN